MFCITNRITITISVLNTENIKQTRLRLRRHDNGRLERFVKIINTINENTNYNNNNNNNNSVKV